MDKRALGVTKLLVNEKMESGEFMGIITVRCAKCGRKIFRYQKMGKGKLWRCWKSRIIEDYSVHDGDEVRCECGNVVGVDKGGYIRLRQSAIIIRS